ncbi:hypothetical protein FDECE_3232, partial [Fusarium decemcellulare]
MPKDQPPNIMALPVANPINKAVDDSSSDEIKLRVAFKSLLTKLAIPAWLDLSQHEFMSLVTLFMSSTTWNQYRWFSNQEDGNQCFVQGSHNLVHQIGTGNVNVNEGDRNCTAQRGIANQIYLFYNQPQAQGSSGSTQVSAGDNLAYQNGRGNKSTTRGCENGTVQNGVSNTISIVGDGSLMGQQGDDHDSKAKGDGNI